MTESLVLDLLLGGLLIGYLVFGLRHGLTRSGAAIAGILAGLVGAWFVLPLLWPWIPFPAFRPFVAVLLVLGFVAAGHAIGSVIGSALRRGVEKTPLGWIDRLLGGAATLIAAALVASVVAASVGTLGVPFLSKAISGSVVLRTITAVAPDPVEAWLAQVRAFVVDRGIPTITGALGTGTPVIPRIDTGSASLDAAAASVVRITGNAYACGVAQSGSGFVIADDRVMTNAHVVAGVTEPVVESVDGQVLAGTVIYFDAVDDLAVILVPGLTAGPLPLAGELTTGSDAAIQGYPFGGPFTTLPADVMRISVSPVRDIYDDTSAPREVFTLAAQVREGNSGGPLLTLDGEVAGVVFARDGADDQVGYAMTRTEYEPVVELASGLEQSVSTGACLN